MHCLLSWAMMKIKIRIIIFPSAAEGLNFPPFHAELHYLRALDFVDDYHFGLQVSAQLSDPAEKKDRKTDPIPINLVWLRNSSGFSRNRFVICLGCHGNIFRPIFFLMVGSNLFSHCLTRLNNVSLCVLNNTAAADQQRIIKAGTRPWLLAGVIKKWFPIQWTKARIKFNKYRIKDQGQLLLLWNAGFFVTAVWLRSQMALFVGWC